MLSNVLDSLHEYLSLFARNYDKNIPVIYVIDNKRWEANLCLIRAYKMSIRKNLS